MTEQSIPAETRIGHVHLKVADLDRAIHFYRDLMGFDLITRLGNQAAFLSAGGYHHHLGLNTWHSRGSGPAPEGTATLRFYSLELPSEDARAAVVARLQASGTPTSTAGEAVAVRDPWQNTILLHVGPLPSAAAATALTSALA